ncbi:MAG: cell division protein FtsZ [Rickettsiales bacterium]|jgi:cell division protein FtsZ
MENIKKDSKMLKPKILIFGVGGAGGNALNNMIKSNLDGVEFIAVNTDYQALSDSLAADRIQLGEQLTKGLGAGSFPDIGCKAAEESANEILDYIEGSSMVFVTAGMGGGTGTGASPVIAKLAKEKGILTVAVITKPFHFEGKGRMGVAESGIEELKKYVDTIIVIPNQNLFRVSNEQTTFESAFKMADDILNTGVRGITDLIVKPGLINLDFADIRTIMTKGGKAIMGTGESEGEDRATIACEAAISNPLLDDISIKGAKGVLVNMTGGTDITLFEADTAVNIIKKEVDENATIIFGTAFKEDMEGKISISVVATGIEGDEDDLSDSIPRVISAEEVRSDRGINEGVVSAISNKQNTFFDPGISKKPEGEVSKKIGSNINKNFISTVSQDSNADIVNNIVNDGNLSSDENNKKIKEEVEDGSEVEFKNIVEEISRIEEMEMEQKSNVDLGRRKGKSSFGLFSFMNSKKAKKNNIKKEDEKNKEKKIIIENLKKIETLNLRNKEKEGAKDSIFNSNSLDVRDDHDNNLVDDILSIPAFLRKK